MKTLPTLSEYILNLKKIWDTEGLSGNEFRGRTLKYVNFLLLKLELWMFIPCDKNGKPLKEPVDLYNNDTREEWIDARKEYEKAQERVIFKGFYLSNNGKYNTTIKNNKITLIYSKITSVWNVDSIQNLIGKVDLVEWKLKELKL